MIQTAVKKMRQVQIRSLQMTGTQMRIGKKKRKKTVTMMALYPVSLETV